MKIILILLSTSILFSQSSMDKNILSLRADQNNSWNGYINNIVNENKLPDVSIGDLVDFNKCKVQISPSNNKRLYMYLLFDANKNYTIQLLFDAILKRPIFIDASRLTPNFRNDEEEWVYLFSSKNDLIIWYYQSPYGILVPYKKLIEGPISQKDFNELVKNPANKINFETKQNISLIKPYSFVQNSNGDFDLVKNRKKVEVLGGGFMKCK